MSLGVPLPAKKRLLLSTPLNGLNVIPKHEPSPSDTSLSQVFCVCQRPYNDKDPDEEFMVCCDNCNEWFHGNCVGITEGEALLLEKYYCPICEKRYRLFSQRKGEISSRKIPCVRSGCKNNCAPNSEKYCSEECGVQVAVERLQLIDNRLRIAMENETERSKFLQTIPDKTISSKTEQFILAFNQHCKLASISKTDQLRVLEEKRARCQQILRRIERLDSLWSQLIFKVDSKQCGFPLHVVLLEIAHGSVIVAPALSESSRHLVKEEDVEKVIYSIEGYLLSVSSLQPFLCASVKNCNLHGGWIDLRQGELEREREIQMEALRLLDDEERSVRVAADSQQNNWRSFLSHSLTE